jgi:wobble nucleotide-excising tRNase
MMITRVNKISRHRVFNSFSWPPDLPDFGRFNLIYGWNGSGKTTLSNLFRYLEKKEPILEGTVDFHIDGRVCSGSSLVTGSVPRIRVFNQDYRDDSVFATTQKLKPIFFLGKDSVEKQKQIESLSKTRSDEQKRLDEKTTAKSKAGKNLDDFCIREAKAIKELLSSSGENRYNNYDKAYFKATSVRLSKLNPRPPPLAEEERARLKKQILETPQDSIPKITLSTSDFGQLCQKIDRLLQQTVLSQVIDELSADPSLAEWVREGIEHHIGEKHSDKCRFCNSAMPEGRIDKLQAHFNDEYNRLLTEID